MLQQVDVWGMKAREVMPGYRGRFVHSDHTTHAYWEIDADSPLPEHAHPHEQVVNMVDGTFILTVAGEKRVLKAGAIVVIPSNVKHSGQAVTACRIMDVFYPVRKDYQ